MLLRDSGREYALPRPGPMLYWRPATFIMLCVRPAPASFFPPHSPSYPATSLQDTHQANDLAHQSPASPTPATVALPQDCTATDPQLEELTINCPARETLVALNKQPAKQTTARGGGRACASNLGPRTLPLTRNSQRTSCAIFDPSLTVYRRPRITAIHECLLQFLKHALLDPIGSPLLRIMSTQEIRGIISKSAATSLPSGPGDKAFHNPTGLTRAAASKDRALGSEDEHMAGVTDQARDLTSKSNASNDVAMSKPVLHPSRIIIWK
ncbi:hypothetical protein DFH27DRAFT_656950 [Peziza echinospora]|nr:hypothetical protein DFH27DRAFT_656950 [Peziza echinospora]